MKRYYVLGGDTFVSENMPLATLVVNDPSRKIGKYSLGDGKVIGRPLMAIDGNFKNLLSIEMIPRKQLIKMFTSANCVFGATRLLTSTGSEFKRLLEQTRKPESFVILGEVYGVKEDADAEYNLQDRVGYEIALVKNAGGQRALACAYKSICAFAEWDNSDKTKSRYCVNASVDRGGVNASIRFKDAEHSGVAMILGTFKSAKKPAEVVEEKKPAPKKKVVEEKLDESSPYTPEQLAEIRLGKEKGLDTSCYERPEIPAIRMKRIRHFLERGHKVQPIAQYADTMTDEVFDTYCRLCQTGDVEPYVYNYIDVGAIYTLYLEFMNDAPDTGWLERARKKAGKKGTITLDILESVAK